MGDPFVRPGLPREPHIQALIRGKYPSTGDADTTKHYWVTEQHRDTIASLVGRSSDCLMWLSVAENCTSHELRNRLIEEMVQGPCESRKVGGNETIVVEEQPRQNNSNRGKQ